MSSRKANQPAQHHCRSTQRRRRMALCFERLERRAVLSVSPAGPEFRVNSYTPNNQTNSASAMDADGDYVIVWHSSSQDGFFPSVYAQRYNSTGIAQGAEFRVNTTYPGSQAYPSVAMDATGDFVVAWQAITQDGSGYGIYAQRYNAAGRPQGTEFQVNTTGANSQYFPSVAMDADGDFVVAWDSYAQDDSDYGIYAQRFNSEGVAQGNEFRVNTTTADAQRLPVAAMDDSGDFVIAWRSSNQDGGTSGIYAQSFDAEGQTRGGEFRVNTTTAGQQSSPTIDMDSDGDFVIAWQSYQQDGSHYGIYAQRYAASGTPAGSEFRVNTTTASVQNAPSVSMNAKGDFIVAWNSNAQDGSSYGVYAQRFSATGPALGAEFRVNTTTANFQGLPTVSMDADGDFVVAWTSNGQDGNLYGVYAKRYDESTTTAGPVVGEVGFGNRIEEGGRTNSSLRRFNVEFSEMLSTSGVNSVLNRANWQLTRDGLDVSSAITSISFSLDSQTNKPTAEVFLNGYLADGIYRLTILDAVQNSLGKALDGDRNGKPGGNYVHNFSIFSAQPVGGEVPVNTSTTSSQLASRVAMDADGDYVITWQSYAQDGSGYGVYAQRYNASGVPQGGEFRVNTTTVFAQFAPVVAMDADGDFVIAWGSYQDGNTSDIYAQRYNAAGVPQGNEFRVNDVTSGIERSPAIDMDERGNFVIAWKGEDSNLNREIDAKMYTSNGVPIGGSFKVNTTSSIDYPGVAVNSHGGFVITWMNNDGSNQGIKAQLYAAGGVKLGGEISVNTYTTGPQDRPTVDMDQSGDFVVAWQSTGQDGSGYGVYAQRFNALGDKLAGEIPVNTFLTDDQTGPSLAMDADGDFVVSWISKGQDGSQTGIYAQRFDAAGLRQSDEFRVNTTVAGFQFSPTVAMAEHGDFVVSWSTGDVFAQRYRVNEPVQSSGTLSVAGTMQNDSIEVELISPSGSLPFLQVYYNGVKTNVTLSKVNFISIGGSGGDDYIAVGPTVTLPSSLNGGDGKDTLLGGLGADTLIGGPDDDTYLFELDVLGAAFVTDRVIDVSGIDTLDFTSTSTRSVRVDLSLQNLQVVTGSFGLQLSSGVSIENVIGTPLADQLTGNPLANTITGGGGDDALNGKSGNDTYRFDTDFNLGRDTISDASGIDTLDFTLTTTRAIAVDLSRTDSQIVNAGLALVLTSAVMIENIKGGALDNMLIGNSLANTFYGLAGNDVLVGREGNDILYAGGGKNILIGGTGVDTLNGASGEDLLLGATYSQETNVAALTALRAEWTSSSSFDTRVGHLLGTIQGGLNGGFTLSLNTVTEDNTKDNLKGSTGRDWYFRNIRSSTVSQRDLITDADVDSVFTEIDSWI